MQATVFLWDAFFDPFPNFNAWLAVEFGGIDAYL